MALPLPSTLSPSKISTFRDCALAFRFAAIDRVPEPPTIPTSRGTLVHLALEKLFGLAPDDRTPVAAAGCLEAAWEEYREHPEVTGLSMDAEAETSFLAAAAAAVQRYFQLEDPSTVHPEGLELKLEAQIGGVTLRGIIDRLDLLPDGSLVVTDYKTGRAPSENYEQSSLGGVHVYSLLCEANFGRRPDKVQLLYLSDPPGAIVATPTEQSTRGVHRRVQAIWSAIELACEREDFRPRTSGLCNFCSFKAWCPKFGGDPALAPRAPDQLVAGPVSA